MPAAASTPTKRTSSTAELTLHEGVPKKPRGSDSPLERHQATLLSEAVNVDPPALQQEPQTMQSPAKPPRGRRRFMADLEELKATRFSLHGHRVNSTWDCGYVVLLEAFTYPTSLRRIAPWR